MKVLLIGDSNLKKVRLNGSCGFSLPWDGHMETTYTLCPRPVRWPQDNDVVARHYTDVVIALGLNHCRHSGRGWLEAAGLLTAQLRHYREIVPFTRLYCLLPPPSLSKGTAARVDLFRILVLSCKVAGVTYVEHPPQLYTVEYTLQQQYAAERELQGLVRGEHRLLHMNADGVRLVVALLIKVIRRASHCTP